MPLSGSLIDTFGRLHDSLRISVTDRCNLRCFYCLPENGVRFLPPANILSIAELERFVSVAAKMGVRKVRVTGGEALLRKDLGSFFQILSTIRGIEEIALTTNGVLLAERAHELYQAGLRRINVHLDTLACDRYRNITRRDRLDRVFAGIAMARELGYGPIKINAVAVKNLSEPDIVPLARFGRAHDVEIRYIEFMPLDGMGLWDPLKVLSGREILATLTREIGPLTAIPESIPGAPASRYRFVDGIGAVGFIGSVSTPFCKDCNRIRLTADGKLRNCLFALEETDVRAILRNGTEEQIAEAIRSSVRAKSAGHQINTATFVPPPRRMCTIGG